MSKKYLKSLKHDFLEPHGLNYQEIIVKYGAEFTWYNLWIQKNFWGNFKICEPYFKIYHSKRDFIMAQLASTKITDLERGYLGLIVNSNFSRAFGPLEVEGSPLITIARFITFKELIYFNWKVLKFSVTRFLSFCKFINP